MPEPRRRTGLAHKTKPRRFISEISLADDFQCDGTVQIDVERFISDPHRTPTQLDRFAVFAHHQLVVLKSFRWLVQRRLNCFLERRLAGFNAASKTLTKHAHRTEFHRSREFIATARAGAFRFRAHGPNRSCVLRRKQHHIAPSGAKAASTAPSKLLSRCTSN